MNIRPHFEDSNVLEEICQQNDLLAFGAECRFLDKAHDFSRLLSVRPSKLVPQQPITGSPFALPIQPLSVPFDELFRIVNASNVVQVHEIVMQGSSAVGILMRLFEESRIISENLFHDNASLTMELHNPKLELHEAQAMWAQATESIHGKLPNMEVLDGRKIRFSTEFAEILITFGANFV